jgi:DNA-binding NtrC family response regulator
MDATDADRLIAGLARDYTGVGLEPADRAMLHYGALELMEGPGPGPDLVVSDVLRPRLNGIELARRLSHVRPSTPVLPVSGHADDELVQSAVLEQGLAFLEKPLSPDVLIQRGRQLLDAAQQARAAAR